jgi:hypothetical protein
MVITHLAILQIQHPSLALDRHQIEPVVVDVQGFQSLQVAQGLDTDHISGVGNLLPNQQHHPTYKSHLKATQKLPQAPI